MLTNWALPASARDIPGVIATYSSFIASLQAAIRTLMINCVEFRSEADSDVAPYCHSKDVEVRAGVYLPCMGVEDGGRSGGAVDHACMHGSSEGGVGECAMRDDGPRWERLPRNCHTVCIPPPPVCLTRCLKWSWVSAWRPLRPASTPP